MNIAIRLMTITVVCSALVGCVTPKPNMKHSMVSTKTVQVPADKALVYFVRPNFLGFAVNAAVYDGDKFIGIVPYNQKLPYVTEPGTHTFMVISEAGDFMQAELLAGKTYYAEVVPRMGAWRARFSLDPMTKAELATPNVRKQVDDAKLIENNPGAYVWADENKSSVQEKKDAYWARWKEKEASQRPFLRAEDGQ